MIARLVITLEGDALPAAEALGVFDVEVADVEILARSGEPHLNLRAASIVAATRTEAHDEREHRGALVRVYTQPPATGGPTA